MEIALHHGQVPQKIRQACGLAPIRSSVSAPDAVRYCNARLLLQLQQDHGNVARIAQAKGVGRARIDLLMVTRPAPRYTGPRHYLLRDASQPAATRFDDQSAWSAMMRWQHNFYP
jgi:hypothetical protein